MHLAALALVLAADTPPVCPNGDAAGNEIGSFDVTDESETLDVDDGHGTITIHRAFRNAGAGPAATMTNIAFEGSRMVIVGARFTSDASHATHELKLGDAAKAREDFDAWRDALERGVDDPKEGAHDAGVLVSRVDDGVLIDVAAPCSVRRVDVVLTAKIASVPVDGAWRFDVPRLASTLRVSSKNPLQLTIDGRAAHRNDDVAISVPDANVTPENARAVVVAKPLHAKAFGTRGFTERIAPLRSDDGEATVVDPVVVTRTELDLPKPLTEAPAGLRFVFVVDASVSVGEATLAKELELAREILDAAPPDAKCALVSFARKSRVVVSPWRDKHALDGDDNERPTIALDNGSDIVAALKTAQGIAADVADDEVARIVVLTDMHLKDAIDDATLVRAFGKTALTHVVVGSSLDVEDPITWSRSFADEDARAAGPEATGGIWIEASTGEGVDGESALAAHLVHPTRMDRPRVVVDGVNVLDAPLAKIIDASPVDDPQRVAFASDDGLPLVLVEGSGLRVESALDASKFRKKHVALPEVHGLLWATPLDLRAKRDESLLALVAVDEVSDALADPIVRAIAMKTNAVSRVTSMIALPEWRPAHPDELMGISGCGCGCGCCASCCGTRGCTLGRGRMHGDLHELEMLTRWLAEDARACLVDHAAVDVEVHDREILDVRAVDANACVVERTWKRRLDLITDASALVDGAFAAHHTFSVRTPLRTDDSAAQ